MCGVHPVNISISGISLRLVTRFLFFFFMAGLFMWQLFYIDINMHPTPTESMSAEQQEACFFLLHPIPAVNMCAR